MEEISVEIFRSSGKSDQFQKNGTDETGKGENMSRILLLEDDLSLINGLSFAFRKQGFELAVARTLKEADSLWADGKYDLLVLDVSLPDGTGFEFCKKCGRFPKCLLFFDSG